MIEQLNDVPTEVDAAEMICEREALVARVKSEVDAGVYETPEKLDAAVERVLDAIR